MKCIYGDDLYLYTLCSFQARNILKPVNATIVRVFIHIIESLFALFNFVGIFLFPVRRICGALLSPEIDDYAAL